MILPKESMILPQENITIREESKPLMVGAGTSEKGFFHAVLACLMLFRTSLAARWIALVTLTAASGILAMLIFMQNDMSRRLEKEGDAMLVLAEQKTAERVEGEIMLVEQRLRDMMVRLEDHLASIATLPGSVQAIRSHNEARIVEQIGKRLRRAGLTGAIIIDHKLTVIATDHPGADLTSVNAAFRLHDLKDTFRELLESNDRTRPSAYRYVGMFDHAHGAMLAAPVPEKYGTLIAWPVFDDFGEPIALIAGYYTFGRNLAVLNDFAATTRTGIALMAGRTILSVAGGLHPDIAFDGPSEMGLLRENTMGLAGRCMPSSLRLSICVFHREDEITGFRDQLAAIGIADARESERILWLFSLLVLAGIMLLMVVLARRLTRPLSEITAAVERVAKGEWRVDVDHAERQDEIGMIARAVASMQVSLIERDRMRQEMIRIDAINQRRLVLDTAVSRFENGMSVVIRNITGTVDALSDSSDMLDCAAREADRQAEHIRVTSSQTASSTNAVSGATMELAHGIREIGQRVKTTHSVVHQSEDHLRIAEQKFDEMSGLTRETEDALQMVQTLIADLGHLGLRATLDAARTARPENNGPENNGPEQEGHISGFASVALAIQELAVKTASASSMIASRLARLGVVADGAAESLDDVRSVLGGAIRETTEMSVVVAEQNAATQAIAEGLSSAAGALGGLTDAVDQLRASMSGAHDVTSDFVLTARRIIEDAKAIDASVRSFVEEVAA